MKTAREVAGEFHRGYTEEWEPWVARVAAAIEQRDREVRVEALEEAASAAGMIAADFLERHNAARKNGATRETLLDLSARWAGAGDAVSRIRSLPTTETPGEGTSP